jgi:hypothetical protein
VAANKPVVMRRVFDGLQNFVLRFGKSHARKLKLLRGNASGICCKMMPKPGVFPSRTRRLRIIMDSRGCMEEPRQRCMIVLKARMGGTVSTDVVLVDLHQPMWYTPHQF